MALYNIPIVFKIFALLICISRMFINNNVTMVTPIKTKNNFKLSVTLDTLESFNRQLFSFSLWIMKVLFSNKDKWRIIELSPLV